MSTAIIPAPAADERAGLPSASQIERLNLCPGSLAAERAAPAVAPGADAEIGTAIHAAVAGEAGRELTADEADLAHTCRRLAETVAVGTYGRLEDAHQLIQEQRLWFRPSGRPVFSGKPDLVAIYGSRALIVDYKTGRNAVADAARNLQLRALVALVAVNYHITEATVVIVQPLADPATTSARYDLADTAKAINDVKRILGDAEEPTAPRIPSEAACRYCRAKAICPEAREAALTPPLPVVDFIAPHELAAALTDEKLAAFLTHAAFAEKVIDACRDEARTRLNAGRQLPGWTLKPGRTMETITDPQKVFDRFAQIGGTAEQFLACSTVGKMKLKDAVAALTNSRGRALEAHLATLLAGATETKTTAPALTRTA